MCMKSMLLCLRLLLIVERDKGRKRHFIDNESLSNAKMTYRLMRL